MILKRYKNTYTCLPINGTFKCHKLKIEIEIYKKKIISENLE